MRRKVWGVILIILGLLLIVAIIYFLFFYKSSAPAAPAVEQPAAAAVSQPVAAPKAEEPVEPAASVQAVSPLKKAEVKPDDLARMAAAFAERFGSFSNQSDYGNIRDLQIFMTAKMQDWSQNYISEARARKIDASIYYGIVTKSIMSEVKQLDETAGSAEILVKTQRRESAGVSGNSSTFYQDIVVKYLRDRGIWRVDSVYWQSK